MDHDRTKQQLWERFTGPNLGYLQDVYDQFLEDPNSVDEELKQLFQTWGPPTKSDATSVQSSNIQQNNMPIEKVLAASKLLEQIRTYGHLFAQTNPVRRDDNEDQSATNIIEPESVGLTRADLQEISSSLIWKDAPNPLQTALDVITYLKDIYTETLTYEFAHVHDSNERQWLNRMVENGQHKVKLAPDQKKELLHSLAEVENFENFLQKTFVGQKRFSIEGVDVLVPMLHESIRDFVEEGAKNVMIGMAHRGRLSVLAHVLRKPYQKIFAEFQHAPNKDLVPSEGSMGITFGWTGDVKYHLGAEHDIKNETLEASLTLANNPSHLEFVDPIVEGYTRAAQEDRSKAGFPTQNVDNAMAILIHGDAAFPGEGVVSETLNLSHLNGYHTGGTLHIITNNQLGFTTDFKDSRSTRYASDIAKGYEIPIVHVNADDPEACLSAITLANEYRKRYKKDFLIDLVGYRRYGHNEMDDPDVTQPMLYQIIHKHETVKTVYAKKLISENVVSEDDVKQMDEDIFQELQNVFEKNKLEGDHSVVELEPPATVSNELPHVETGVDASLLTQINKELLTWPEGFNIYPKLERILKRRLSAFEGEGAIDWGHAETLAFATILNDGVPIRITGQDSERGTFAHRHLVLHDSKNGSKYSPLHTLPQSHASFAIHNSPLSETSVLGFEYGYNVEAPETLTIWEAQYGDFANVAQVLFDQFISAGRAKWGQKSGLVMLLPHGYEGQGPEHSSARLERYLQLAAENNWTVANLSSAAQYFHILRRQAAFLEKDEIRPLVLMAPKSLIRNPVVSSPIKAFTDEHFSPILEQPELGQEADKVERIVLTSGKMAIDIAQTLKESDKPDDRLHIVRVEELYPFPKTAIEAVLNRFKNLKELIWVQEEPKNMGVWSYIEPKLWDVAPPNVTVRYTGRPFRSSPATGDPNVHKLEQKRIVTSAITFED